MLTDDGRVGHRVRRNSVGCGLDHGPRGESALAAAGLQLLATGAGVLPLVPRVEPLVFDAFAVGELGGE